MITEIETGIDNSTWNEQRYVKVYFDRPLGDTGTPESILEALAREIDGEIKRRADAERRADLRTKARMEIYKAASDICDKYNMKFRIEVSE